MELAMTFSPFEVVSALAVVAMLILNLSLRSGLATLKITFERDLNGVQLQLANMRTEIARDQVELLEKITNGFVPRREAEAFQDANTERLKGLHNELRALAVRVGDIG